MKKLLLVTVLTAFLTILSATSSFAQEVVRARDENNGITSILYFPVNNSFPNEKELKRIHYKMVNDMMKDITRTPRANKRVRRSVVEDTGAQIYTGRFGQEFTNDAQFNIYGLYKIHEMHLVTKYKIYSTTAEITSTSTAGTTSYFPGGFPSQEASILSNNARTVSSRGTLVTTVGAGVELSSRTWNFTTTITIQYAGDGTITFTARTIIET